ncbi:DNA/RNA endonuclease G [Microbacterium sp.]|uniref:DNA/RNA endonuclease G n=1 Tax=Microbacterium sp. TaxID=51671 RepID=UPI003342750B
MASSVLDRVTRRETHSPRSAATVTVLVLAVVAMAYAGTEIVLELSGRAPLLVSPAGALRWLIEAPTSTWHAAFAAGAAVVVLAGVVLLVLALSPGRLSRQRLDLGPQAVIADNGVIASAIAERVRREFDLSRGGAVVGVGHRSADVTVRPEPGQHIDPAGVRAVAEAEFAAQAVPGLRVRARVQRPAGDGSPR